MEHCFAEVNLSNYTHNLGEIRRYLPKGAKIMAVIKANAYGCGIVEIAKKAIECGIYSLGVARINEALIVRNALPHAKIVVLGYTMEVDLAIANNIELCVYHRDIAEAISREAVAQGKIAQIHIKIDTGMGRIGYLCDECSADSTLDEITHISQLKNIHIAGIFTHFSSADEEDLSYTKMQCDRYSEFVKRLEMRGIRGFIRHCANSAGIFSYPQSVFDMVRVGIVSYGINPFLGVALPISLKPVLSLKARVVHIKTLPKDSAVSYGRTFITNAPTKIATISVGYADGYSRLLSNKAEVLIRGIRAKVVGNVCMDQICVDISEIERVEIGDCAVLFGVDECGNEISADELAQKIGTISYEILCAVSNRVRRVYR